MIFFTEMATNTTANDIKVILYSANNDALIAHLSTERRCPPHSAVMWRAHEYQLPFKIRRSEAFKDLLASLRRLGTMMTVIWLELFTKSVAGRMPSSPMQGI